MGVGVYKRLLLIRGSLRYWNYCYHLSYLVVVCCYSSSNINEICMSTNLCSFTFVLFLEAQTVTTTMDPSTTTRIQAQQKKNEKNFWPIKYLKKCNTLTPLSYEINICCIFYMLFQVESVKSKWKYVLKYEVLLNVLWTTKFRVRKAHYL